MTPALSLCLIVKNEEAYLRRCVESFGAIDDELIIVDTGSTDGTVDLARELLRDRPGRLEHFTWQDDFAAARNYACSLAQTPWILMVDADEYLSPDLPPRVILEAIREAPPEILNLLLVDLTLHDGQVIMAHPVNRLFRNHPQVQWVGRIHESLTVAATQQLATQIALIHDNARKRLEGSRLPPETSLMYERGLVADTEATPENPRPVFYLGNTLAERGEWEHALAAYRRYLELAGPEGWSEEVWQAHQNIAMCRSRLGDARGCREALMAAIAIDPRRGETYLALGDCALQAGRRGEARIWYQFAATLPVPTSTIFVDIQTYGLKPWWKLGTVLIEQQDYPAALAATEHARQLAPQDEEVRERLQQLRLALLDGEEPPTVVILSRTPDLVDRCLEGMLTTEGEVYYETLVVCDGGIEPFEPLLERFPRLRLLAGRTPFVYARNANLGIEACEGDVVLLNDDAVPQTSGWLDLLRQSALSRPDAGPVSACLSQSGNPLQDTRIHLMSAADDSGGSPIDTAETIEAPFVTFVCVYLRRELLDRVGPLDTGFVWYGWEDNDYCQRAAALGLGPLVNRQALVRHDEPSTSFRGPEQARLLEQARHYFERKHLRPAPPCNLLVRLGAPDSRAVFALRRLLNLTSLDCRILLVAAVEDVGFVKALRGLEDPRLALRFQSSVADGAALMDELAGGGAEVVAELAPSLLLPAGWLESLLVRRFSAVPGLGVLALPWRHCAPEPEEPRRIGGIELLPAAADSVSFERAPVHLVARRLLEHFGPVSGFCGQRSAWCHLAERLERRGHVNGFVWPLAFGEVMQGEGAA